MCHFVCTIDSAELEQDFVPLSGSLPGFKGQVESVQIFHFMQHDFEGNPSLRGCIFGWGMTFSKCKKSTGSLVVFIPLRQIP